MKAIVIIEFDPDEVIDTYIGNSGVDPHEPPSLESVLMSELGWLEDSGISAQEVIIEDSLNKQPEEIGNIIIDKLGHGE